MPWAERVRMPTRGEPDQPHAQAPVTLPTGTVTFLFSDIEGSSRRWEANPQAMRAAVARHEELMRRAIEQQGGYVFKTVGDAFCAVFHAAPNAVRAALDAQRALADEDFSAIDGLRVRMGLHSGSAEERDADYFGAVVNRVARLMSIGHGGQVLVSGVTYELSKADVNGAEFSDLGLHRLKDLAQPEQVWQVGADGLSREFGPLLSLNTLPNNLPVQVTTFIGRERDLEELKAHLAEHRMVTLFGSGGVGKTRLAAQVGAELLERYPDGVWVADLAPITDPESVPSVIAQALGANQAQGLRGDQAIPQWLKTKQLLLILDNCEHLVQSIAVLADAIHRNCPTVHVLATSREALGVSGEKVLRLASLAVPAATRKLTVADAMQFGAVALFADRASLVSQSFCLNEESAPIVADVCRRLDGIPLAIELAAARVKMLSVSTLAQHLNERFKILTAGSRTALPRQQTLRALIDWSYDLLAPQEQELFNRLAIFAGSFTLEAATHVCAGDGISEVDVFDMVASLADKSLVVVDTGGSQERSRLLESTRQYALEKLTASGELERVARRHAEYYLGVAKKAERNFGTISLSEWLTSLEPEVENFRATLEWALAREQQVPLGSEVVSALDMLWWHGGLESEGRRWVEVALHRIDEGAEPTVAARLRNTLALLTSRMLFS